jgi:predicted flap endonuclease-1-like 5' DNA nuclease
MARIDQVAGIGHRDATKLRKAGVRTSTGLIDAAASRKDRADLASATGIDPRDLQQWINHSDLLRVRGVGAEYAELLVVPQGPAAPQPDRSAGEDHRAEW